MSCVVLAVLHIEDSGVRGELRPDRCPLLSEGLQTGAQPRCLAFTPTYGWRRCPYYEHIVASTDRTKRLAIYEEALQLGARPVSSAALGVICSAGPPNVAPGV